MAVRDMEMKSHATAARSSDALLRRCLGVIPVLLLGISILQAFADYSNREQRGSQLPEIAQVVAVVREAITVAAETNGGISARLLDANNVLRAGLADVEVLIEDQSLTRAHGTGFLQGLQQSFYSRGSDRVFQGTDGWLYLEDEIRSVTGRGPQMLQANPGSFQVLEAIAGLQRTLLAEGADLLIVPIPAKAAVWPEGMSGSEPRKIARPDLWLERFCQDLERSGIAVVDLWPLFREQQKADQLYCRTDTHLSGHGIELLAEIISRQVADRFAVQNDGVRVFEEQSVSVEMTGDLARMQTGSEELRETQRLRIVTELITSPLGASASLPVESQGYGDVLLMGDSHTLVYDAADLHAKGAGLVQHLTADLGRDVEVAGVRGSGVRGAYAQVVARETWRGKRLVVWCFAARELTVEADESRMWSGGRAGISR
ncbi:MAG: alginate O-acetyltransferase AlgX-related protein [Planctomycetaceae bacterium]|jgi:alginate O-acetyltransferase complex protein AlgJ